MISFTRRMKQELNRRIAGTRITVRGHTMEFNIVLVRWLKVYLDTVQQFRTHENLTPGKARKVEDRVRSIALTRGLTSILVTKVQVAAV